MSKNIVKGGYVVVEQGTTITIDNNELIRKKLEELRKNQPIPEEDVETAEEGEFSEGIDPIVVQALCGDEEGEEASNDGNEQIAGVNNVREEARAIIDEAMEEAEVIKSKAHEEGYAGGFEEGKAEGLKSLEHEKERLYKDFAAKEEALINKYDKALNEIEPAMVDKLTEIYEHVLGLSLSDSKSTILFLLKKALGTMDGNKKYCIHVSGDDFDFVLSEKESVSKSCGIPIEYLEIIEDHSLSKNGCMIETEGGIFDIGLDTQLSSLTRQLKILSMEC